MAKEKAKPTETTVAVQGDHITLGQLLKAANVIGSGGEAKYYLEEHIPLVNGEPDQRRGRKLRPGDVVVLPNGLTIRLTPSD